CPADHRERSQGGHPGRARPRRNPRRAGSHHLGRPHRKRNRLRGARAGRRVNGRPPAPPRGPRAFAAGFSLVLAALLLSCIAAQAQELRIASYNMERLGQDRKDYASLARVVARNDLVAAEEVMNAQGMARLLDTLGSGWSDFMSAAG